MNGKVLWWAARIAAVMVLTAATGVLAQDPPLPEHLSGIINDYTPLLPSSYSPRGPWELRGHWSLDLKGNSGKADFSAYLTMELSDSGVAENSGDLTVAASRMAHAHHFVMTDATVSTDPADLSDTSKCPASSPSNTPRFLVSGTANFISANGNDAPFEKNGTALSTLYVCISGATYDNPAFTPEVEFSNITLTMVGPAASKHFGPQAINGAVRFVRFHKHDVGHDKD
jgi:hypothetical protein